MKWSIYLVLSFAFLISVQYANADDDSGYYAGISINRLSADFKNVSDVDFGESENAGGLRAGYMFNNNIGVEVGYLDLGNYVAESDTPGNRIDLDAEAFNIAVVVNYAVVDRFDLYGRIGVNQINVRSNSVVAGTLIEEDDDQTEAYGAVGIEWDFGLANLFFELSKVETDISNLSIDIATIGFKYEVGR